MTLNAASSSRPTAMADMTPERLAEIRAAAEAATEGPWVWIDDKMWSRKASDWEETFDPPIIQTDSGIYGPVENDRAFISLSRTAIPELLAEIERLSAALAERDEALKKISTLSERPPAFPADWGEQIAACPDCQRYKTHPVMNGICDTHRKPIYEAEAHRHREEVSIGYRAKDIARAVLTDTQ